MKPYIFVIFQGGGGPGPPVPPLDQHMILRSILLLDFSLTVKAATLIFISGRGSAISSAK